MSFPTVTKVRYSDAGKCWTLWVGKDREASGCLIVRSDSKNRPTWKVA